MELLSRRTAPARGPLLGIACTALLGLALAASCAPAAEVPGEPGRLTLRPLDDGPTPRAEVVRTVLAPETQGSWAVQAPRARLRPARGELPRALELLGDGEKRVRVPGPFAADEVRRVRLHFELPDDDHLAVWLRRGDDVVVRSRSLRVPGQAGARALDLDLPLDPGDDAPYDDLLVHVYGTSRRMALHALDLIRVPPAARLPDPADGAAPLLLGWEERLGVGLAAGRPLACDLAPRAGDQLAFSYGRPASVLAPDEPAAVRVVLGEGAAAVQQRFPLPTEGWAYARVPLDPLVGSAGGAGRAVRARFELEGRDGAVAALGEPWLVRPDAAAPLVLLVTSDTHRGDHLGAADRGVEVETPTLDALARRGVLFTDCFSSANYTIPSHSALFTGRTPRDTGVVDNYGRLADRAETLAERFRDAGWLTMASVSARLLHSGGVAQGFERFAMPSRRGWHGGLAAETLERWLDDARGRPTFVWLHLFDAHRPYRPPDPAFDGKYWPDDLDPADPEAPPPDLPLEFVEANAPGLRRIGYFEAQYRAEVDYLDSVLGRTLERAEQLFGSTVVAVTADHGESLGQHGIWWSHEGLYPDTLHVPLILAWPGAPAGTRVDAPVRQVDLSATLLELAGLPADGFGGTDLLRALAGDAPETPRFALSNDAFSASVTAGGWHLILNLRDHHPEGVLLPRTRHAVELYDLTVDPGCERDLSAQHPDRARELRAGLVAWLDAAPASDLADAGPVDQETRDQIAALGYAESTGPDPDGRRVDPDCECDECARWR